MAVDDMNDAILEEDAEADEALEKEVSELTLDQMLFNRPFPGLGQYRGPFDGFYMCGSGTHPGGGVMGAPGANAAREMLKDFKHGVV